MPAIWRTPLSSKQISSQTKGLQDPLWRIVDSIQPASQRASGPQESGSTGTGLEGEKWDLRRRTKRLIAASISDNQVKDPDQ